MTVLKKGALGQQEGGEDRIRDMDGRSRTLSCMNYSRKYVKRNKVSVPMRSAQAKKTLPCSFCRRQVVPSGQSGLSAMFASRRPFFRSRIHQSFRPYRSTSAAHILQIRWRGASRPGSGPGGTLWTSTNRSSSMSGANPRGCERMCSTIYKSLVKQRHTFRVQKRQN